MVKTIIMKEFLNGLKTLIGAFIITVIYLPIGYTYTYGHAFYWWIKGKKTKTFFQLIWRQVDGTLAALGYLMHHVAVFKDMLWNVNGELIEDLTTTSEETMFGVKNTTVSTATGNEEVKKRQKPLGVKFNVWLNWLFGQKRHAVDSLELHKKKEELAKVYFQ